MAAFQAALDLGVRYLETDVHATTDGQLIAFHDHELDRVTDGTGVVAKLPWQVVRNAKIAGREPIPLLADVLGSFPEARLNIDVKAMSAVGPLLDVLAATDSYDRVVSRHSPTIAGWRVAPAASVGGIVCRHPPGCHVLGRLADGARRSTAAGPRVA